MFKVREVQCQKKKIQYISKNIYFEFAKHMYIDSNVHINANLCVPE